MNRSKLICFVFVVYVLSVLFPDLAHAQEKKILRVVFVSLDKKFTLDRVIDDRILKQAQQELKSEGRLRQ